MAFAAVRASHVQIIVGKIKYLLPVDFSPGEADLAKMCSCLLMPERLADLRKGENPVDGWFQPVGLDRADHILLVLAAADGEADDAAVAVDDCPGHELDGLPAERADHVDIAAYPACLHDLGKIAADDFHHMIHAVSA